MSLFRRMAVLLVAMAALALVAGACGGDDGDEGGGATSEAPAGGGSSTPAEPISVGLVTDIGGVSDRSFNFLANEGLKQAVDELGVDGRLLESKSNGDYIPNLQEAGQSSDLVISIGFLMGDATEKAAEAFGDASFAIVDYAYDPPIPNVDGLVFKEQEAGYLAGYVAAKMSKSGTISTVGGQKIPPVDHYIAGFQAGAKKADPQVTLLNGYSQDFIAQDKCKELALDQIANGSDVVFQVAGQCGLGALDAAKQEGVWGVGVDADQGYLGDHILTSAMKRVDVAVFDTIKSVQDGTFKGGQTRVFGLDQDGVGLGKISPEVPQDVVDDVQKLRQDIIDGTITVPDTVG